jgi:hypothetical protein
MRKECWDIYSICDKLQLEYLDLTVQEKLRSGWPGPFVKVEGCCN